LSRISSFGLGDRGSRKTGYHLTLFTALWSQLKSDRTTLKGHE
jgi:hypothetical protein